MQHDLGVAFGVETMAAGFEFRAQSRVVVDLAVEADDGVAVRRIDRLIAAGNINNAEADRAHGDGRAAVQTLLIRAAMADGVGEPLDALRGGRMIQCRVASDAAQSVEVREWKGFHREDSMLRYAAN